jgi:hypothetical protein
MTAGIDTCSLVPLYIEPHFGDISLGGATAFLWLCPDGSLALITNWHVASGRNHETGKCLHDYAAVPDHLRVYVPYSERGDPPLVVTVPTVDVDGQPVWIQHPVHGAEVDAVAFPILLPPPSEASLMPVNALRSLPLKQRVGMPIYILGFPFGRTGLGMPVWKQASFASEPVLAPEFDRFLIVDTASRPGMSGSPVIQRQHGQIELENDQYGRIEKGDGALRFVGIYSGRFHTNSPNDAQLGRVWPAALLVEIVAHMMQARRR